MGTDTAAVIASRLVAAGWAGAFDDVIDGAGFKAVGEGDDGNGDILEAEGLVAFFTIEVGVHVGKCAFVLAFADLIFDGAGAVVYRMDDMMLFKGFQ